MVARLQRLWCCVRVPVLHISCVDAEQAHDICAGTLTHEVKAVEVTVGGGAARECLCYSETAWTLSDRMMLRRRAGAHI